jgi:hypothetical protein
MMDEGTHMALTPDLLEELTLETAIIQQLSAGVTRQWLYNKRIVAYRVQDIHRKTVDAWAEAVTEDVNNWSPDRPLLNLHDFTAIETMSFSPYVASRARALTALAPNLTGRTALLMQKSLVSTIVYMFLKSQHNRVRPRQIFTDAREALAWLKELLG